MIAHPIHGRARIQHDAAFGQHHAGRLTRVRRMITGRTQQQQFHGMYATQTKAAVGLALYDTLPGG